MTTSSDGAELDLDLPSLSFTADELDFDGPAQPADDLADSSSVQAVNWHEDSKKDDSLAPSPPSDPTPSDPAPTKSTASPTPPPPVPDVTPPPAVTLPASTPALPASFPAASTTDVVASRPASTSVSLTSPTPPTHQTRLSIIAFEGSRATLDLSSLNLPSPDAYLRMFKAVLTLQRKCRAWRLRIKEKMRLKVADLKRKQDEDWALKLHNIQQQRKHVAALRQASTTTLPSVAEDPSPTPSPPHPRPCRLTPPARVVSGATRGCGAPAQVHPLHDENPACLPREVGPRPRPPA